MSGSSSAPAAKKPRSAVYERYLNVKASSAPSDDEREESAFFPTTAAALVPPTPSSAAMQEITNSTGACVCGALSCVTRDV